MDDSKGRMSINSPNKHSSRMSIFSCRSPGILKEDNNQIINK
jgi:hypothetical protein